MTGGARAAAAGPQIKLYEGDCLEIMKTIPDSSVDLILCDLPYGMTNAGWDIPLPLDKLWEQYDRVKKERTPAALFAQQPFTTALINSNPKRYRYVWYWIKNTVAGFNYARYQPMRRAEEIHVFYDKLPIYRQQNLRPADKSIYKPKTSNIYRVKGLDKYHEQKFAGWQDNVLYFDADDWGVNGEARRNRHPCQKPAALLEFLIKTYTGIGDTVLDNCMGAGSAGVACAMTGRNFIGIEKDKTFFARARKRVEEARIQAKSNLFTMQEMGQEKCQTPPQIF